MMMPYDISTPDDRPGGHCRFIRGHQIPNLPKVCPDASDLHRPTPIDPTAMYFDLFLPFPIPEVVEPTKKKKDKGKGKQPPPSSLQSPDNTSCWEGLSVDERDDVAKNVALAGHCKSNALVNWHDRQKLKRCGTVGYSVIGCTVSVEPSNQVTLSPFRSALPFPHLDPRKAYQQSSASGSSVGHGRMGSPSIVQSTRYHMRLDDSKTHCLVSPPAFTSLYHSVRPG